MTGKALTVTGKWNWQKKCVEIQPLFWDDIQIADGSDVTAVLSVDRNPAQLRFYWAVVGEIVKAGLWDGDKDTLDDYTRMSVGFGHWRPIASETDVLEPAWQAAWQTFLTLTGLERLQKHFRKGIETYVAATPPRTVFIPDSISLARCDGLKFTQYLRDAEKVWAERLGVDIEMIRQNVPPMEPEKSKETNDVERTRAMDEDGNQGAGHDRNLQSGDAIGSLQGSPGAPAEPLGARLKRLAEALHKDTPDLFSEAWAALKVTADTKELHRLIPKQVKAVVDLNEGFAHGRFNERDYVEILAKILADAEEATK